MRKSGFLARLPLIFFEVFLVVLPILFVVFLSFTRRTDSWNVELSFTLDNYRAIFDPIYMPALRQSLKTAIWSTAICILLGYPAGLAMGKIDDRKKSFFLKANMVPFLFNSMMRICGLIIILRSGGLLDTLFMKCGFTDKSLSLLYSFPAAVTGMVYVLLPLMTYSVYSSVSKMNSENLEAASVLGASPLRAFFDVTLPLSAGGLLNGIVLCFIPAMGLYIITSLLGGGKIVIVSNVIEDQIMKTRNIPFGAALSVVLMILTACFATLAYLFNPVERKKRKANVS